MTDTTKANAPDQGGAHETTIQKPQTAFSYPSPDTVKGRVLGALLRGERITHWDCWKRFGSARLSHHIYMLRGMGWAVEMIEQAVTTCDAGRTATVGVYSLHSDVIAQTGERGQQFAAECALVEQERRAA